MVVDATRTKDPDGQPVTIKFDLLAKPKASKVVLSVAARSARFKPDAAGTYRLRVRGTDPLGAGFETVYTFVADNRGPNPVLVATVGETIGTPRTATVKASVGYDVLLDSARSSDPDGNKLTRSWQIVSGPSGSDATLSSRTGTATVLSPDVVGNYVVRLTVTDSRGAKAIFNTTVQVDNRRPVAQVGTNATPDSLPSAPGVQVPLGTELTLRGDASEDADGDVLAYAWSVDSRPAGSTARPSSATAASPLFTPDRGRNVRAPAARDRFRGRILRAHADAAGRHPRTGGGGGPGATHGPAGRHRARLRRPEF
ncbi:hypothetical protein HK414_09185 [Ramlibacter terrae]|uniref:PKD domain-containing protein n=1 Tax=Ramlibacter terrae TaxID=2732511 RepID=A0ABX6P1T0_9BURK|nr:hypothetical protein HK414_09185 [Ramlibacter terrae]